MTDTNAAVETEAIEKTVFEYDGAEYTVDKDLFDDLDVQEAWEDGKHIALARAILGDAQWKTFKLKKRKTAELYDVLNLAFGKGDDEDSE